MSNVQKRFFLAAIAVLIAPFTFIWSKGYYFEGFALSALSDGISYTFSDPITTASVSVYLLVIFAFLTKRNLGLRSTLIVSAFVSEAWALLYFARVLFVENKFSFGVVLKYLFVRTDGFFPWQIFNSVAVVMLVMLFIGERLWIKDQVSYVVQILKQTSISLKRFGDKAYSSTRFALINMVILIVLIFVLVNSGISDFREARESFNSDFHAELLFAGITIFLGIWISSFGFFIFISYAIRTYDSWRGELSDLNRNLTDFRLSKYVTRLIAGYLYWLYVILVVIAMSLAAPVQTIAFYEESALSYDSGFHPELALILILMPVAFIIVGYLIILLLRLVFEVLIATIHIAQNTTQKAQLNKP